MDARMNEIEAQVFRCELYSAIASLAVDLHIAALTGRMSKAEAERQLAVLHAQAEKVARA